MKVQFGVEHYDCMFNLGVELWFPGKPKWWKKFQVNLLLGPYCIKATFGSKRLFDKESALLADTGEFMG